MRLDLGTALGRFLMSVGTTLLRWWLALMGRTWRIRIVAGAEHLQGILAEGKPVIFCCWHARILMAAWWVYTRVHVRGLPVAVLASQSRDGEVVARISEGWGAVAVRGSTSRGPVAGLRGSHRVIRDRGRGLVIVPDGPRGPAERFQAGGAMLARLSGAPVVLLGFSADRAWRLGSWDRLIVPKPFARISVVVGTPRHVPRDLGGRDESEVAAELEDLLNEATDRAEAGGGREPAAREPTRPG